MASQSNILDFFKPESGTVSDATKISNSIINDIISAVIFKSKKVKHDGNRLSSKTLSIWKQKWPWLLVESNNDDETILRCALCKEFDQKTVWATTGTTNCQSSTIERHCDSGPHHAASKLSLKKSLFAESSVMLNEDELESVNVSDADKFLLRTIYMVMKEELPLDKVNSILDLQRLNKCEIPYRNLSWTTITELQNLIAGFFKKDLIDKLKSSDFFAILIDESTDITISKRLSVCVRYVYKGTPETSFLANIELSDGTAYTITETLLEYLRQCNIDITKCVSLATDGASVMMGRKSGVGVQFVSKAAPYCVQTHCVAHRLNLAVCDSIKDIEVLKKFSEKFSQLYHFFSASTARTSLLKNMQKLLVEPELSIKEPYSVRWVGLKRAVEVVYDCYESLLTALSKLANDNDAKAKGLYKYFRSYKTALLLGLMLDVHTTLGVFCCQLQYENLIFSDVPPMIDSVLNNFECMKTTDGNGLHAMKNSIEIKDEKAFYKGEELLCFGEHIVEQVDSVRQQYLTNIMKNIKKRIPKGDCKIMTSLCQVLEPCIVNVNTKVEVQEALQTLSSQFGSEKTVKRTEGCLIEGDDKLIETPVKKLIDETELGQKWSGVLGMLKGSYKHLSLQDVCMRLLLKHQEAFPNFSKLASIALCIQVTSVECERSFSSQNRIKSKYRASLGNTAMDALMTVSLYGPTLVEFNPTPCAKQWVAKSRRKKRLMAEYKPRTSFLSKKQKLC